MSERSKRNTPECPGCAHPDGEHDDEIGCLAEILLEPQIDICVCLLSRADIRVIRQRHRAQAKAEITGVA